MAEPWLPSRLSSLLRSCRDLASLSDGRLIHNAISLCGLDHQIFFQNLLLQMYGSCRAFDDARDILNTMAHRNLFTWSFIIRAYAEEARTDEAFSLFERMKTEGAAFVNVYRRCGSIINAERTFFSLCNKDVFLYNLMITLHGEKGHSISATQHYKRMYLEGLLPDKVTFITILCASVGETAEMEGERIHSSILSTQFKEDVNVCNSILSMYSTNGKVRDAKKIFKSMAKVDAISCNTMMTCYVQNMYFDEAFIIFEQMWNRQIKPTKVTYATILQCHSRQKDITQGRRLHSCILEMELGEDAAVCNAIIRMYGKCGSLHDAWKVFDGMCEQDVVSWAAIVTAYAENGQFMATVQLLNKMRSRVVVDKGAFTSIVSAFITSSCQMNSNADIRPNKHALFCGSEENEEMDILILAKRIFDDMETRDVVVWNVMISAYAETGLGRSALQLFVQMLEENMLPDQHVCSRILSVCSTNGYLKEGMRLQSLAVENNLEVDAVMGNSLLSLYGKRGSLEDVKKLFYSIPEHDAVTWSVMIGAFSLHGNGDMVLQLYQQMLIEGGLPDKITFLEVLSACSDYTALNHGKQVHAHLITRFVDIDLVLGNGLINMYAKCGDLHTARKSFDTMLERDVSSWNAMISAYAQNGFCGYALHLFWQMKQVVVSPNSITLVSVLSACSYGGMLYESFYHFISMYLDHKIRPELEHYNNMIDVLGRIGTLDLAEIFIRNMPYQPTTISWMIFLSSCKYQLDFQRATEVACFVLELDSSNLAPSVVLTSIYTATGKG